MNEDTSQIIKILSENYGKNFVKRIVDREKYPVLSNPDGTISTHSMAWSNDGDRYFVYPTVVMRGKQLSRLDDDEAFENAMRTGEFIEFNSPDTADWFTKNYKSVWNMRR